MEAKSAIILTAFVFAILTAVLEIMSVLMQNEQQPGFSFSSPHRSQKRFECLVSGEEFNAADMFR